MKKLFTTIALAAATMSAMATDYTGRLVVNLRGTEMPAGNATISVNDGGEGKCSLTLKNFSFMGMGVGTIDLKDVDKTQCGVISELSTHQTTTIAAGEGEGSWMGPSLGLVPINVKGRIAKDSLNAMINITMPSVGVINVMFGDKANEMGQVPNSGFEAFHKEAQGNYSSDEPNAWHSFMSSTGIMSGVVSSAVHTYTSDEVRPGSTGKQSVKVVSALVFPGSLNIPANGTLTTGQLNAGGMSATDDKNHAFLDLSNDKKDGNGDPFYASMTSRPDSLAVWVKFHQGPLADKNKDYKYASVSAVLTDGTRYQMPEYDNKFENIVAMAKNQEIGVNGEQWQRISIPFDYASYNFGVEPKALFVTIGTNAQAGVGSTSDEDPDALWVDDFELIYNANLTGLKVKGQDVEIGNGNNVEINGVSGELSASDFEATTDGQGAFATTLLQQDGSDVKATVYVTSADLKTTNTYTFVVKGATTGIDKVQTATGEGLSKIYNVNGQRVNSMSQRGIYIVRTADGKTVKVLKK